MYFLKKKYLKFKQESLGATAIEYALIVSLISVVIMAACKNIGRGYLKIYNNISSNMSDVQ